MATEMEQVDREQAAYARGYADALAMLEELAGALDDLYSRRKLTQAAKLVRMAGPKATS